VCISVMVTVSVCPMINVISRQDMWKNRKGYHMTLRHVCDLEFWGGGDFCLLGVLLQTCLLPIMTCFCNVLAHSDSIHDVYLPIHHSVASLGRMKWYSQIPIECHYHHLSINAACLFIHTFIHLPSMQYNHSS